MIKAAIALLAIALVACGLCACNQATVPENIERTEVVASVIPIYGPAPIVAEVLDFDRLKLQRGKTCADALRGVTAMVAEVKDVHPAIRAEVAKANKGGADCEDGVVAVYRTVKAVEDAARAAAEKQAKADEAKAKAAADAEATKETP